MKTNVVNAGLVKIGTEKDGLPQLWVEAPVKERDEFHMEPVTLPDGRKAERCVVDKPGKKLRVRIGRDDEPEPNVWHFYKRDDDGILQIVKDSFKGTRDEAVAACIAAHG